MMARPCRELAIAHGPQFPAQDLLGHRDAIVLLINQLRAILLERGIIIDQGRRNPKRELEAMHPIKTSSAVTHGFAG